MREAMRALFEKEQPAESNQAARESRVVESFFRPQVPARDAQVIAFRQRR